MKKGDWVFDGCESIGKVKHKPYEVNDVVHIDVVIYNRDGEKVGRVSPACGGPRGFEPACTASQWQVIKRPNFPLSRFNYLRHQVTPRAQEHDQ